MDSTNPEFDDSRRGFLRQCSGALLGVTVVGAIAPALAGCEVSTVRNSDVTPNEFDVSTLTNNNDGLVTTIKGPEGAPLLIVRISDTEYVTLSMRCTHEGCTVNAPKDLVVQCPCHGSRFDLTGRVLAGPAQRRLTSYITTYNPATRTVRVQYA